MNDRSQPGGIIVIDGPDGTGKATTSEIVLALMNKRKPLGELEVMARSFPNYQGFFGIRVDAYLKGEKAPEHLLVPDHLRLNPFFASTEFASDRAETYWYDMKPLLDNGHWFLLDRYYTSNMGHQGSRMETDEERLAFFNRLLHLEEGWYGLPRPDLVVILELPEEVRRRRTEDRRVQARRSSDVTVSKVRDADIHEQDPDHMRRAADTYQLMSRHFGWPTVNGFENGHELTPNEMAEKVYSFILKELKL